MVFAMKILARVARVARVSDLAAVGLDPNDGGVAECLRCNGLNFVGSTSTVRILLSELQNHKPIANSAAHPFKVGK